MHQPELQRLANRAELALQDRHADGLKPGERFAVRLLHHGDARRVQVQIIDPTQDRVLELVADVPELVDEEAIPLALDFLDRVLDEVLQNDREAYPPLDPTPYTFEDQVVYLSGGVRRPGLEKQADELLRQAGFDPDDVPDDPN
ncbi:MAG: hypothetical protein ABIJ09_04020 [Pseudomonadota bacterium]